MKQTKIITIKQQEAFAADFPLFRYPNRSLNEFSIEIESDGYIALVESILAQQLSAKVAKVVIDRFYQNTGFDPRFLATQSIEQIKAIGCTKNKAIAIQQLSQIINDNPTYFKQLHHYQHDKIIQQLVKLHQVGPWTAEMFMIFSMDRPDVLSFGDLIIKKGLAQLWNHPFDIDKAIALKQELANQATLASLMIWEMMENPSPL